ESKEENAPHPALSRRPAVSSTGRGEERGLKVGDQVMVVRNTNARWLHEIGMDRIPPRPGEGGPRTSQWKPGPREPYDRTVAAIEPSTGSGQAENKITLDIPLFNDITADYGGGFVYRYNFSGRIARG